MYARTYNRKAQPAQLSAATQRSTVQRSAVPCCTFSFVPTWYIITSTYVHATSGLFYWIMELLAFASRLFAPKMLDHLPHLSFRSIISCERITPSSSLSLAQLSSTLNLAQLSSAAQHRAVSCGALCFLFRSYLLFRTYQVSYESTRYQGMCSSASSAAQRSTVRCRTMTCSVVRCGAVPCCAVLSLEYIARINPVHVRT